MNLEIFSSNQVEILFEQLNSKIHEEKILPFHRHLIVVPSHAIKTWLQLSLAQHSSSGIAAGVEIDSLDASLSKIDRLLGTPPLENSFFPSPMEFSWMIEFSLRKALNLPKEEHEPWLPLFLYLRGENLHEKKQRERLLSFTSTLAALYSQYEQYNHQMLEEWEKESSEHSHWQAAFWRLLKKLFPSFYFPYRALKHKEKTFPERKISLHLFAMSFLPRYIHAFFEQIASKISVKYYLLSPCQMFWSDLCSEKEAKKMRTFWKMKGVSKNQLAAFEKLLDQHNALLANFGNMGRKMALLTEESDASLSDLYALPQSILQRSEYQELFSDELLYPSSTSLSLLEALQADMVLLRNTSSLEKLNFSKNDHSIQLHHSPTKLREIENLYNSLAHIITTHANDQDPILPSDIIVMAPDLVPYEAYIHSVFGSEESQLPFQLLETGSARKSSLIRGFFHLLELASHWKETQSLLSLIEYEEFQRKWEISRQDLFKIQKWIEKGEIDLEGEKRHPVFDAATQELDSSEAKLLKKWIDLTRSLKQDLDCMPHASMPLVEWSTYLRRIKETYFQVDLTNPHESAMDVLLLSQIHAVALASKVLPESLFSFDSIKRQFEKKFEEEKGSYQEENFHSVRFCSLLSMRALPAKVLVLIGMGEEYFPRKEITSSLNLTSSFQEHDYSPSQGDFDRHLFLEALLSARRYFLLTYVNYSLEEQREVFSSPLIREFFNIIDEGYTLDGNLPSLCRCYAHTLDSFHKSYFEKGGISYIPSHYRMAIAHYGKEKQRPHCLISRFFDGKADHSHEKLISITIKDLNEFASNPIKSYCNHKLNLYISKKEKRKEEEDFVLSPLVKYQLQRDSIQNPIFEVVEKASQEKKLPLGIFKTVALENLEREVSEMQSNFEKNGVNFKTITSLSLSESCDSPQFSLKEGWKVPALLLKGVHGNKIKIIGTLQEVSEQGILSYKERNLQNFVKLWPQYLLLHHVTQLHSLPIKPQIIFSKHSKPIALPVLESQNHLLSFLEYYFSGRHTLSLLSPEWIHSLLKKEVSFDKIIQSDLTNEFHSSYNEYALWLFREHNSFSSPQTSPWHEIVDSLFGDLPNHLK